MLWRTLIVMRKNPARSRLRAVAQHGLTLFLCLAAAQSDAHALDGGADAATPATKDGGADASTSGGDNGGGATLGNAGGEMPGDAGADAGTTDAGSSDAGSVNMSMDASTPDQTAACSCESDMGSGAREIHLCTGSFDRDVCRSFSCTEGTLRSARCDDDSPVKLCCDMPARGLYTYLYQDCTHPNCETGFRAQCADFAGEVVTGRCDAPGLPDDPNTGFETTSSCGVSQRSSTPSWLWLSGSSLMLVFAGRRRIKRSTKSA